MAMRYDELCTQVTATIVDTIEAGQAGTWRAPWHHNGTSGLFSPTNAVTGRSYATGACGVFEPGELLATRRRGEFLRRGQCRTR